MIHWVQSGSVPDAICNKVAPISFVVPQETVINLGFQAGFDLYDGQFLNLWLVVGVSAAVVGIVVIAVALLSVKYCRREPDVQYQMLPGSV